MKTRILLSLALGAALMVSGPSAALAEKLVISNWDGYMPKDMAEKFKAATGIDLEIAVHATNEEIMGKVTASGGEGFDVLFVSSPFAEALNKLGLVAPIDHAKVPNLANLYPEATQLKHDPGNAFSVPYTWGTTGLCYRSDLVKAEPDKLERPAEARRRPQGQDHHAGDRPLADGGGLPRQRHVGQHHRSGQPRQGARPADRNQAASCSPMTTRPSIPSSSRARPRWSMPGMAGATTASPRSPRSNT